MLSITSSSKMAVQRSPSILPSILQQFLTPACDMHPQTISKPSPDLSVLCTSLSVRPSPGNFRAHFLPSEPNLLIFVTTHAWSWPRPTGWNPQAHWLDPSHATLISGSGNHQGTLHHDITRFRFPSIIFLFWKEVPTVPCM